MAGPIVYVFDKSGNLQDIPPDIISGSVTTACNGGSTQGQIVFPRSFWNIGAIAEGYRFQVFMPDNLTVPWWDGRVTEEDTAVTNTYGKITVNIEGYLTALDDAEVNFTLTPGVQPNGVNNGQEDYAAFLTWMINLYEPSGYTNSIPASAGANLVGFQAQHQGLGQTIDQVTKSILDSNGAHWEWYCDGTGINSAIQILVQPVSTFEANPIWLDQLSDCYEYDLHVSYRDIKNMITLYGGTDPTTGQQCWGVYSDSGSIATWGLRQTSQTISQLTAQSQIQQYATAQLAQLSQPVYTGSFKIVAPNSTLRAGKWVSVYEGYTNSIRTMRLVNVQLTWQNSGHMIMTCQPNNPIPSIDSAIFDTANGAANTLSRITSRPAMTANTVASALIAGGGLVSFT